MIPTSACSSSLRTGGGEGAETSRIETRSRNSAAATHDALHLGIPLVIAGGVETLEIESRCTAFGQLQGCSSSAQAMKLSLQEEIISVKKSLGDL